MNYEDSEAKKASPVQVALVQLEKRIAALNELTDKLEARISVAIRPTPVGKEPEPNPNKPPQPSALVEKINRADDMMSKIEARIINLLDGLDL